MQLALARIAAPRPQPDITADITTFLESVLVVDGENESQSDQRPYSTYLLQECGLRIIFPGDLLDLAITVLDLFRQPGLPGRRAQGGSLEASNRDTRYFNRGFALKAEPCFAFKAAANASTASPSAAGIGSLWRFLVLLDANGGRKVTATAPF